MSHSGHHSSRPSPPAAVSGRSEAATAHGPAAIWPCRTVELTGDQALRLLGGASLGRIVFTQRALPAIRPVNHLLDRGQIVIRTHRDSDLFAQTRHHGDRGVVVAYQADDIDPQTHLGWSVVATGYCRAVTDPEALMRYQRLIRPWSDQVMDCAVRIRPHLVTGIRLTV
ncbi:pyridoxamine 5'-phosphate oxidase family protein [Streptomyces sp. NBC_01217]|uniref:pyridoxamine 5'-phosphate oxidase family protein n=1 Tax=Streptomyces sp. NBC_01217 TaxID=2903779 RepID=UPI002E0FE9CE|nr:pyridoxamine 5'-phosphate oxidase family protein [Streptomyces sp. NBC_01217]